MVVVVQTLHGVLLIVRLEEYANGTRRRAMSHIFIAAEIECATWIYSGKVTPFEGMKAVGIEMDRRNA